MKYTLCKASISMYRRFSPEYFPTAEKAAGGRGQRPQVNVQSATRTGDTLRDRHAAYRKKAAVPIGGIIVSHETPSFRSPQPVLKSHCFYRRDRRRKIQYGAP